MTDDPIGRHLAARARTIDLPRTDVGTIAERATRRRQRRHRVAYGVAGVALLAGTSFAVLIAGGGDDETPLATTPDAVVDSPLEWTTVDPAAGLGFAASTVATDDGALYSLSTAPGAAGFNDPNAFANRTLYRSATGTDWERLALPEDLYATSLAAEGSRLYAVGTGPTGGEGVPLRISSSDDGGTTWGATADLPSEITELQAAFGPEVNIGRPVIATHGGTTLVAVTLSANPDVAGRVPGSLDTSFGWNVGPDGVEIYGEAPPCDERTGRCANPPVIANLTWDQLELPEELRALIVPRLYLLASSGGGPFEQIQAPIEQVNFVHLIGSAEGFTLAAADSARGRVAEMPPTRLFTSPDGHSWTEGQPVPGLTIDDLGLVGDGVMAVGWTGDGQQVIGRLDGDGFDPIDPLDAVEGPTTAMIGQPGLVAFGPLGWATLLQVDSGYVVVHSDRSGASMSTVVLPDEVASFGQPLGVTVSADAITVRFVANDGVIGTVERQRLWVGTPAG